MGPENGGVDGSNRSGGDDGVGDGLVEWTEVVKLRKAAESVVERVRRDLSLKVYETE